MGQAESRRTASTLPINALDEEGSSGSLRGRFKRGEWDEEHLRRFLDSIPDPTPIPLRGSQTRLPEMSSDAIAPAIEEGMPRIRPGSEKL